jgi:hypothetical protein
MTIDELNEFMYKHGFCNTNNEEDIPKKYVADLVEDALKEGYNKGIDAFYDKALNFEDYINPIEIYGVQLYSSINISSVSMVIKKELLNKINGVSV